MARYELTVTRDSSLQAVPLFATPVHENSPCGGVGRLLAWG